MAAENSRVVKREVGLSLPGFTGRPGVGGHEIVPWWSDRTRAWAQLCNVTRADTLASELGTNQQAPAGQPYSAITSSPPTRPRLRARGFATLS